MAALKPWGQYTIKTQLLVSFAGLTTLSLLTILSILLGYISLLNTELKRTAEKALIDQSAANLETAGKENFQVLEGILEQAAKSFLSVYGNSGEDCFRAGYR